MTRLFVIGLLFVHVLLAQSGTLATTADGSSIHFSSCAALRSEPLQLNPCRVYAHGPQPAVIAESQPGIDISYPYLSADGQFTGFFGFNSTARLLRLQTPTATEDYEGSWLALSPNARFVGRVQTTNQTLTVLDRATGLAHTSPAPPLVFTTGTISNDGHLVLAESNGLWYFPFNEPRRRLLDDRSILAASITTDSSHAFVLASIPPGNLQFRTQYTLLDIHIASGRQQVLYDGLAPLRSFTASDDGSRILLQTIDELLLWHRDTGWRSLLSYDEGFSESRLTGSGNIAFARTSTGRLLQIDTATGTFHQLYAPFPSFATQGSGGAYPGSILRFQVSALRPGLSVTIDGDSLPIVPDATATLDTQIPWESTSLIGRQVIAEITAPDSPFALRASVRFASAIEPWAFTAPSFGGFGKFTETFLIAAREDFLERIDQNRPARHGSVVHFWLTGLGPLDTPTATGQRGLRMPLARPLAPLSCSIANPGSNQPSQPLPVLDVTYAPDLIGLYQVDIRLPADWSNNRANISCASGNSLVTGGLLPIQP